MGFRRTWNHHDVWLSLVRENMSLLTELPKGSLVNEQAFRDYVTSGIHRGVLLEPSVSELSARALNDLAMFINYRTQFDMDVIRFDAFKTALRTRHSR
jgi:hypothetical protein